MILNFYLPENCDFPLGVDLDIHREFVRLADWLSYKIADKRGSSRGHYSQIDRLPDPLDP
jgi:hypothetical protein